MIFVGILFPCQKNSNWRYNYACHLFCDKPESLAELHDFALRIGLKRQWFQSHTVMPHYDLTSNKKEHALRRGAIEVDRRTEAKWIMQWRRIKNNQNTWTCPRCGYINLNENEVCKGRELFFTCLHPKIKIDNNR